MGISLASAGRAVALEVGGLWLGRAGQVRNGLRVCGVEEVDVDRGERSAGGPPAQRYFLHFCLGGCDARGWPLSFQGLGPATAPGGDTLRPLLPLLIIPRVYAPPAAACAPPRARCCATFAAIAASNAVVNFSTPGGRSTPCPQLAAGLHSCTPPSTVPTNLAAITRPLPRLPVSTLSASVSSMAGCAKL